MIPDSIGCDILIHASPERRRHLDVNTEGWGAALESLRGYPAPQSI